MAETIITTTSKDQVLNGISVLFNMLDRLGQPAFPRNIMTHDYPGQFTIHNFEQMYNAFERASFKDCRVSAYSYQPNKELLQVPNLLLLDMDLDHKLVTYTSRDQAKHMLKFNVNKLLKRLQRKFKITNFMVLWSGNGYHILIPFHFDQPFEHYTEFAPFRKYLVDTNVSEHFLRFAKSYISKNKADPANNPSFSSMFLRVPGTINTKNDDNPTTDQLVTIEHEWCYDGERQNHDMQMLVLEYQSYLMDKMKQYNFNVRRNDKDGHYNYVRKLLMDVFPAGYRKHAISLILVPYLVVICGINSDQEIFTTVREWLDKCDKTRMLDVKHNWNQQIYNDIERTRDKQIPPMSLSRLREDDPALYHVLSKNNG